MSEGRDTLTGYRTRRGDLLGVHNAKTIEGESLGVLTAIMYLAPASLSGFNVCPRSTPDCRADCLYTSGRGAMQRTKDARTARTLRFFNERPLFMRQLVSEIQGLEIVAERHAMRLAVRLNGTSDILWERVPVDMPGAYRFPSLMAAFPQVTFYDYTKHAPQKREKRPPNYALAFSAQRETLPMACEAIAHGLNVAAVVEPQTHALLLSENWRGRFHDASSHDVRFMDPAHSVGLLLPKGSLRKRNAATSGMILTEAEATALGRAAVYAHAFHETGGNLAHYKAARAAHALA